MCSYRQYLQDNREISLIFFLRKTFGGILSVWGKKLYFLVSEIIYICISLNDQTYFFKLSLLLCAKLNSCSNKKRIRSLS